MLRFTRKTTYYRQPTHELNLPAGWSCPHASACKVKRDRQTGATVTRAPEYQCYAAGAERFPSVRDSRWANYAAAREHLRLTREPFDVPRTATHVRIHGSGDFFNQEYFDRWLMTAATNPDVHFWSFTKSLPFWAERLDDIPPNLTLTASVGGTHDQLIQRHGLRTATVYGRLEDVPADMPIDVDDWWAQQPGPSFALLENYANHGQAINERVLEHNRRIIHNPRALCQ